jgi:drug/metabolite transporter (DMT)-like permease
MCAGFSFIYLREPITLSQGFGLALIAAGAFFVVHKW